MDSNWPYEGRDAYGLTTSQQDLLINNGYVYTLDINHWFCDACNLHHEFENEGGKLYKTCLGFTHGKGPQATEEETKTLWFDLTKLTKVIVQANHLAKKHMPKQPKNGHFVGFCTQHTAWLTDCTDFESLKSAVDVYQATVQHKNMLLISLRDMAFLPDESTLLKAKGITVISLTQLIVNSWKLPSLKEEPEARLVIDRTTDSLKVDGKTVKLELRLFKTALLIAEAAPSALKNEAYDQQYYGQTQPAVSTANPPLTQAVSELKALFKREGLDPAFVLKAKGQGYIVSSSYTVQIL